MDMNTLGISFSEADGLVLLVSQPTTGRPLVDSQVLHQLLNQEGYGECLQDEAAIASAANLCNVQQTPFGVQVAQRLDAVIRVQIAPDELSATLSITPAQGGKAATLQAVMQALTQAGVISGIDQAAVQQACQQGACADLAVAFGVAVQNGTDAIFEELIPQTVDRQPKLDENGLIDYREHGVISVVPAGAALMRRSPAVAGVNGQTVTGKVLAARPGHDALFAAKLEGAEVSGDDPNLLLATVSGQPVRVHCGVMVEPVLRVKNVNMATGNIHFDGTVHVAGEIVQGMKVQASGDIVVDGMVDSGQLEAGGNIRVAGGVIAHASLRAGAAVSARFAQGARIEARTVIALADMALDCELRSRGQIIIGADSAQRGRLIGGTATAMLLLQVPLLGSAKSSTTKVAVGANPELEARFAALLQRIEQEKATEANLEKLIKQLKASGDPKGMLNRVKASRQHAVQVWGKSLAERAELEKEIAVARSARVVVGLALAGSVDLSFGHVTARLRREFAAGTFTINPDSKVVFTDIDGHAKLVS